jgi:sarcosine oxidase subunit gamma
VTAEPTLAHRTVDLAAIGAVEVPLLAQVDVRVRMEPSVGLPLPTAPNTVQGSGGRSTLWLGPDEWLVTSGIDRAATIVADLRASLAGRHHAVVDVSANRAVVDLTGPDALELLATGCPLDLHPARWRAGMCAQTQFARAPVTLEQRSDATRVFVRPSFADYVVDRLLVARE